MAKLTRLQTAYYLYEAGFRGTDLVKMVAIAGRESGYESTAHRTDTNPKNPQSGDRGLFQINYVHDANLKAAGIINTGADLFNPQVNAKAAYFLYQRGGLNPWQKWQQQANGSWVGVGNPLHGVSESSLKESQDAVNMLLQATPGGLPIDIGDIVGGIDDVVDVLNPVSAVGGAVKDPISAIGGLVQFLMDPHSWVRILQIVGGGVLLLLGIVTMVGPENVPLPVAQAATAVMNK